MRDKLLKDKLKVNQKDLKAIFYEIKDYYSNNYNYWLQLGIAEQLDKDYEKALNHFTQAEALGPKSYMVKMLQEEIIYYKLLMKIIQN